MKDNDGIEQDNPELFDWKDQYEKEHKLRQEAETETILVKGIGMNSPEMKAAKAKIDEMRKELDRVNKDNNDLFIRIAELTEIEESHRKMNGKLQERLTEVEEDNRRLALQIEDQVQRARKAGL
jgi:predicted transcriptional regulator